MLELLNTQFMAGVGRSLGAGGLPGMSAAPAGPSQATAAAYGSGLDGSGWAVNFSGVQSASSSQDKSGGIPGVGLSGVGGSVPWYVWAALAGIVAIRVMRAKKG